MKRHKSKQLATVLGFVVASTIALQTGAFAGETCYDGFCFPQGDASFADTVIHYDPAFSGGCVPDEIHGDPSSALGPPSGHPGTSLGDGGLLELGFTDNVLTNSGDSAAELVVFELGGQQERTFLAIRPANDATEGLIQGILFDTNDDGFYEIGSVEGFTSAVDIDALVGPFPAGMLVFDAIQLLDDVNQNPGGCGPPYYMPGADIDAVGVISADEVCLADLDSDGTVGASDLLALLASWGPCKGCPADFDGDGSVGASDLLALLVNWGPCP